MPAGRPKGSGNKVTPEVVLAVCEQVAEGKTLTAAAKEQGTAASSIRYALLNDAELFEHSVRAKEIGVDALADECIAIADDPEIDAANKRIMIDTRIRLIGKWSQRYSDKVTVETNQTVTHQYDLNNLGTDQLEQLEGILAIAERGAGRVIEAKSSEVRTTH